MAKEVSALEAAITRVRKSAGMFNESLRNDIELIIGSLPGSGAGSDTTIRAEVFDQVIKAVVDLKTKDTADQRRKATKKPGPRRRTIDDTNVSEEAKDEMRLRLLEARLMGEEAFQAVSREVLKELGLSNCRSRNRTLGGMVAHTQGKHRNQFIRRVLGRTSDEQHAEMTQRLKKACGIDDTQVSHALAYGIH